MNRFILCCICCCILLTGCRDYHTDYKGDPPDLTYLNLPEEKAPELKGYDVAWSNYKGRDLDYAYWLSGESAKNDINVVFKHIYSPSTLSNGFYESWYIVQQSGNVDIKDNSSLNMYFIDTFNNSLFKHDQQEDKNVFIYWLTSTIGAPQTAIVRLRASDYFNPNKVAISFYDNSDEESFNTSEQVSGTYIKTVYTSTADIKLDLGYAGTSKPISLLVLQNKYYVINCTNIERKVSENSIKYNKIFITPLNGSVKDFNSDIKGKVNGGSGNRYTDSDNNEIFEFKGSMNLPPTIDITAKAKTENSIETVGTYELVVTLKSKDKSLKELFDNSFVPSIYYCNDDFDNAVIIAIDTTESARLYH